MGDKTKIEWSDATWNPYRGTKGSFHCTKVSPGCENCYAEIYNIRGLHGKSLPFKVGVDKIRIDDHVLLQPLVWRRPRRIFVNSMSDTFHETMGGEAIARLFAVMALARQHTFQVLTKRSEKAQQMLSDRAFWNEVDLRLVAMMRRLAKRIHLPHTNGIEIQASLERGILPNVWIGNSVENGEWFDKRIDHLRATPAAVRFLSMEPLLGNVEMRDKLIFSGVQSGPYRKAIDWVIIGGESGRNARPMQAAWVDRIIKQCRDAGVAVHFKQWGEWLEVDLQHYLKAPLRGDSRDGRKIMFDGEWRELRETIGGVFVRMGKKAAGRQIHGRTWDEFPTSV